MSHYQPTVAIVGRPNVGKSALFNRLASRQIAIVHDQPGVTRDRVNAPCPLTQVPSELIDTGGIGTLLDDGFSAAVLTEAQIAMASADLILFVVDSREGVTSIDEELAFQLRKAKAPVQLLLNKADTEVQDLMIGDFAKLGLGEGLPVSAAHGKNMDLLLDQMDKVLTPLAEEIEEQVTEIEKEGLKIAVVGKPNAGKSSLINAILKDERSIVSEVAGTTRDAVDIPYEFEGERHTLIDTAGLRPRSRMDSSVEVFSAMRSERSVRRADLCLLVVDLAAGISAQDRKIARLIQKEKKPCLIVANKYDLFHPDSDRTARLEEAGEHVRNELFFLSYAPFVCVSALKNQALSRIFGEVKKIRDLSQEVTSTGQLNRLLSDAVIKNPPSEHKKYNKRIKILYGTAAVNDRYRAIPVPTYILFVNDKRLMQDSYEQYLSNYIHSQHRSYGVPVIFSIRSRSSKGKLSH